jgi:hypothetical protein
MAEEQADTPLVEAQAPKLLNLVPPSDTAINEGCVNILREALKRAKNGEVQGVAICLAVKDPDSYSGRGSIHMTTWAAAYKDTLYTGVGAMDFSMKQDMHNGVIPNDRIPLADGDE